MNRRVFVMPFQGGSSVAVLLFAWLVSCVAFALPLFVPRLPYFLYLGKAVLRDCVFSVYRIEHQWLVYHC